MARNFLLEVVGNGTYEREVQDTYYSAWARDISWVNKPVSGVLTFQYKDAHDEWRDFNGGIVDLSSDAIPPAPYIDGTLIKSIRIVTSGVDADTKAIVEVTIDSNFGSNQSLVSYSPFEYATKTGYSLAASFSITIPGNTEYSLLIPCNADRAIHFIRANGLFVEYYTGVQTGQLVELGGFTTLNTKVNSGALAGVEVYNGHPSGERVISNKDEVSEIYYPNGLFCAGLSNKTDSDIKLLVSIGIEKTGGAISPYMLSASTQIESTTEMSDYNGTN